MSGDREEVEVDVHETEEHKKRPTGDSVSCNSFARCVP